MTRRVQATGKVLALNGTELPVHGVTYGTFRPRNDEGSLPSPDRVRADLGAMTSAGINAIRTYDPPPAWFLDLAADHGMHVMAGLPWEQHVAFLGDRAAPRAIERRVRDAARAIAG